MRRIILLLLAAFTTVFSYAQEIKEVDVVINPDLQEEGELAWSGKPITWNEFKGAPDRSCQYTAMTFSGIKLKYSWSTRGGIARAKVEVCPYMDLGKSWYKEEGHNDPTLLHEQRHFDLTAVVTAQFIEELKNQKFTISTFPSELKKLHERYLKTLAERQKEYDGDTEHGTLSEKQAAWDKQIAEQARQAISKG